MLSRRSKLVGLAIVAPLVMSFALLLRFWERGNAPVSSGRALPTLSALPARLDRPSDAAASAPARAAAPGQDRDSDAAHRSRIEHDKMRYVSRAPDAQPLTPELMADPELYEAGPGPHLERYGGRSGALPISARPEDAEVTTVLQSEGEYPKLSVWVPSFRNGVGDLVKIRAQVVGEDGRPAAARDVSVSIVEKASQATFQGVMGRAGDAAPEGTYGYEFKPPASQADVAAYDYVVFALVETAKGEQMRVAQGAFQVHGRVARVLANEARVEQNGGNVLLELPVQIDRPGDYTFYAELWGGPAGDVSVAFAAERADALNAGRQVVRLTFGGLVIKDRKVDGPFVIRNVRVRRVSDFPFAEADPVKQLAKTPPWAADSFG